jgi:hypothetical protein
MIAALLVSPALLAQTVSVGMRAGPAITHSFSADRIQELSLPEYTIGPAIEMHLWRGSAIGADFLLQGAQLPSSPARITVRRWELPVTIAYHLHRSPISPFVRAGLSLNRVFDTGRAVECARGPFGEQFYCVNGVSLAELRHRTTYGPVMGLGGRFPFKKVRLDAEIRLTRWIDRNFGVRDSRVRSNLTQIEVLGGATF